MTLKYVLDRLKAIIEVNPYGMGAEDQEAVSRAIEALSQEPKWIPCEERLPEDDQVVLCTTDFGKVDEMAFYTDRGRGFFVQYGNTYSIDEILAWMPLPKPYRR